ARDPLDTVDAPLLPAGTRAVPTPRRFRVGFLGSDDALPGDLLLIADVRDPLTRNRARLDSGRAPAAADEALVTRRLAKPPGLLRPPLGPAAGRRVRGPARRAGPGPTGAPVGHRARDRRRRAGARPGAPRGPGGAPTGPAPRRPGPGAAPRPRGRRNRGRPRR